MSKQWGHGHHTGQVDALRQAAEAIKHLQDKEVYAMALVNKLMLTHHDKELVEEVHQALRKADHLWKLLGHGMWYGHSAGMFVETHPPMPKKAAMEWLFTEARKNGWNG